jgi:hypothetical protein
MMSKNKMIKGFIYVWLLAFVSVWVIGVLPCTPVLEVVFLECLAFLFLPFLDCLYFLAMIDKEK